LYASWPREALALRCLISKQALSGSRDPFPHLKALAISLERMKLDISNLVCGFNIKCAGITNAKFLQYEGAFMAT